MQTKPILKPRQARIKALALVILLGGSAGLVSFWCMRQAPKPPRAANPAVPAEVSRTNLVLVDGRLRLSAQSIPFSGFMVEHYPDGQLRSRSAITNGLLCGLSQGWHPNGQLQVTEYFKEGISDGVRTKWYPDGAKQSEATILAGQLQGTFRKWHENGTPSEQVEFVAGQPEGISVAYFPSGCLRARVVMKDGKPIEQKFWKDGEKKG